MPYQPLHRLRLANLQLHLDRQNAQNNVAIVQAVLSQRRRRRRREVWVKPWLQRRPLLGQYERLMAELRDEDIPSFRNFVRVDPEMFHELLVRLGDRITKKDTWYRKALEPGLKLAITLRFLGTGRQLSFPYVWLQGILQHHFPDNQRCV